MPARHYSAYIIGLFPSIYDWCVNICGRAPILDFVSGVHNGTYPQGSAGFIGVLAWKRGSLLVSMVWTAMVVMILDRKWMTGAIWAMVGALFALFGIIHVPQAGFQNFASPTWEQCPSYNEATGLPNCWEFAEQWMFFVAYIMLAATFGLIEVARRYFDKSLEDVLDDPSAHAFDDWVSRRCFTFPLRIEGLSLTVSHLLSFSSPMLPSLRMPNLSCLVPASTKRTMRMTIRSRLSPKRLMPLEMATVLKMISLPEFGAPAVLCAVHESFV